ncbi:hypothetical protein IR144_08525 [Rothia nasimurium]|nr:hypothetical protein [Rothia nasimurium]MBF0808636.1 hypothetical protein [Rothia nasimurium]
MVAAAANKATDPISKIIVATVVAQKDADGIEPLYRDKAVVSTNIFPDFFSTEKILPSAKKEKLSPSPMEENFSPRASPWSSLASNTGLLEMFIVEYREPSSRKLLLACAGEKEKSIRTDNITIKKFFK